MKKILALVLFTMISTPALADWKTDLSTAISSGDSAKVSAVYATYPDNANAITMELLTQAKNLMSTNPTLSSNLCKSCATNVADLTADEAKQAADIIRQIVTNARDTEFQKNNPAQTASLFSCSLTMAGTPIMASVAPDLYEQVLISANEFLDKKPVDYGEVTGLEDQVLLAQTTGFAPIDPTGPAGPSAD